MYVLEVQDNETQRRFTVRLSSPYLLEQWKKKHKIPYSKRLVVISEKRRWE